MKKVISIKAIIFGLTMLAQANTSFAADQWTFGNRNSGGPNGDYPTLYGELVAGCIDGWTKSTRCKKEARLYIADKFCRAKGYKQVKNLWYRNSTVSRVRMNVYNFGQKRFKARTATSYPQFFVEITCETP